MKKQYTPTYKAKIVQEILREEKTLSQISSEYGIHATQLRKWKRIVLEGLPSLFESNSREERALAKKREAEKEQLYAEIGRLTTQLNWLKKKGGLHIE